MGEKNTNPELYNSASTEFLTDLEVRRQKVLIDFGPKLEFPAIVVRTYIIAPRPLQPQRPLLRKLVKTLESLFESCGAVQLGPNGKNQPKIRFKHFRKLTDYI